MRNKAIRDAMKFMLPTIILGTIMGSIENVIRIISSTIIGDFTNSVLSGSVNTSVKNIWLLVITSGALIFIIPTLNCADESLMFKKSLDHDKFLFNKFLNKNYLKANVYDPGELSNRLERDAISLRWSSIAIISNPVIIVVTMISLGYYLFSNSIIYGVVCIGASLLPLIIKFITRNIETRFELKAREYGDKKSALERELYDNFIFIKFYNLSNQVIKKLDKLFYQYYNKVLVKDISCKSLITLFNNLSTSISKVIVVLMGAYLVSKNQISVGLIASFLGYMGAIEKIVSLTRDFIGEMPKLKQNGNRVAEFYIDEDFRGEKIVKNSINEIKVNNLGFSYNDEIKVWDNISLDIKNGDKVVLSGDNGSGKSTFIKCLSGLYSSYKGNIMVNELDLNNIDINWWRDQIAYIEQDPFLFKATIKENILIGNAYSDENTLMDIAKKVNLSLDLDKVVDYDGENLSGGQKQKISIARGLIKKAPILILDEPLNNLDLDTKDVIHNIIKDAKETVLFISHDKETCKLANKDLNFNLY